MKTKPGQILLAAIVGLFGILSANAQQDGEKLGNKYQFRTDTIQENGSLQINQGIKSKNGKFIALMQEDGNFCQYQVDGDGTITHQHCTETHGDNAANKGHRAWMSNDGSFKIVTNRMAVLFTTETGGSDDNSRGQRMVMHDDGRLIIYARNHRTPLYEFGKGKL